MMYGVLSSPVYNYWSLVTSQWFQQSIGQPKVVANPDRCQLNRENCFFFLSPFAPKKLVFRDRVGRPVSRHPTNSQHSELNVVLINGAPLLLPASNGSQPAFIYLNRRPQPGQSRVHRVTQLRIDSVHHRESTGTGPVVLKEA